MKLLPLAAIEIFVWAALIVCIVVVSKVAFGISVGNVTLFEKIATQIIRLGVSTGAVLIWLVSWKKITQRYFWRAVRRSLKAT